MAFCQKCGQQIDDTANNCPYCGATNVSNPNAAQNNFVSKVKKLNLKNIGILGGGVVVLVIVIVLIASLFGGGQKKAIQNMIDATMFGKEKAVQKLAPKDVWEYIEDEYDVDIDDLAENLADSADDTMDYYEDEYGKNVKIKFKIEDTDEVDKDDLSNIKDNLKNIGIKKKDVKEAVEVDVEITIKGKEDEDTEDGELILVKIGGDWYVYDTLRTLSYYAD